MHIEVSKLHPSIAGFLLSQVSYCWNGIGVSAAMTALVACSGGNRCKGFAILVDLDSGECRILWGSWGGANIFNPGNRVDRDTQEHVLPVNGAVISGSMGGGKA